MLNFSLYYCSSLSEEQKANEDKRVAANRATLRKTFRKREFSVSLILLADILFGNLSTNNSKSSEGSNLLSLSDKRIIERYVTIDELPNLNKIIKTGTGIQLSISQFNSSSESDSDSGSALDAYQHEIKNLVSTGTKREVTMNGVRCIAYVDKTRKKIVLFNKESERFITKFDLSDNQKLKLNEFFDSDSDTNTSDSDSDDFNPTTEQNDK